MATTNQKEPNLPPTTPTVVQQQAPGVVTDGPSTMTKIVQFIGKNKVTIATIIIVLLLLVGLNHSL